MSLDDRSCPELKAPCYDFLTMTAEEMSARLVAEVAKRKGASFVDLMKAAGPEAKGDLTLERRQNLVLWDGVSPLFADALDIALNQIEYRPTIPLVYHADGGLLSLAIAQKDRPYKRPRWFPVAFYPRKPRIVGKQAEAVFHWADAHGNPFCGQSEEGGHIAVTDGKHVTCPDCRAKFSGKSRDSRPRLIVNNRLKEPK